MRDEPRGRCAALTPCDINEPARPPTAHRLTAEVSASIDRRRAYLVMTRSNGRCSTYPWVVPVSC